MAHPVEPMDIDSIDSDFDNKENTFHHNNVQPCTEKGYEELDVSELNMRLRYSVTPAASPMSKSFSSCVDHRTLDLDDSLNNTVNEVNLTRSLNATLTKNDNVVKSLKSLPLQSLPTDQPTERNVSVLRPLDSTITKENNNITLTVSGTNDNDENLSMPSSSSSEVQTPEATTPTKEIPKNDGGSPIMRGLKSVLNMFRSSQSPIPPPENESTTPKQLTPTPSKRLSSEPRDRVDTKPVLASTPIAAHRDREGSGSKRSSPYKDSIIFNDDLEKELQWKDETTILFSEEKIPIHKLFYPQKKNKVENKTIGNKLGAKPNLDATVEYMDISCNDSIINDRTMTELSPGKNKNEFHANESDSEFLDCETVSNLTKTESFIGDNKTEGLIKESHEMANVIKDLTFSADNKNIVQQISETDKKILNVTVPLQTDNTQDILGNHLLTSKINLENINSNKSILDNVSSCEENKNTTKVIENVFEDSKFEISGIDSEQNHDITMTFDSQEIKGKTINNMLEVSTLESHTQSLSSLIESLDATKTIDSENKTISNNNSLEMSTPDKQIQVSSTDIQDPDLTITFDGHEHNILEAINTAETLNPPKDLPSTTQNLNITIGVNKEGVEVGSDESDSLEHKVLDTTVNLTSDINEAKMCPPSIQLESSFTPKELQNDDKKDVIPISESPADIPLPDDEDIEKDVSSPIDTIIAIIDEVHPPNVERSIAEIEVKGIIENAVGVVSELNSNDKPEIGMILQSNDLHLEKEIKRVEIESQEDVTDIKDVVCEVNLPIENETKKDIAVDDVKNINETSDKQTLGVNDSIHNESTVPDIHNQQQVDYAETIPVDAPVAHAVDNGANAPINEDFNKTENTNFNLSLSNNKQPGCLQNDDKSNISSSILPENQMTSLILACEEILDKNREISEVILTEQKIDKLQHESEVVLSNREENDVCLQISQNDDQHLATSIDLNNTFKKDELKTGELVENTDIQLGTEDVNKSVSVDDFKIPVDEPIEPNVIQKDEIISLQKDLPSDKNIENIIEEDVKPKHEALQENIQEEEISEVENDKIDESTIANKTVTMGDDEQMKDNPHIEIVQNITEEPLKDIEQDKTLGNETFSMNLNVTDTLSAKPDIALVDDEIIVSENNSPYVSVAANLDKLSDETPSERFEEIENPFATNSKVPTSPPITSKGYNFDFDDIDDPFATKVKIRMSPTSDTPNKTIEIHKEEKKIRRSDTFKKDTNKNRRKSQPARPRLSNTKKPFNTTFDVNPENTQKPKDEKVDDQQNMSIDLSNDVNNTTISTLDVNENSNLTLIENIPQAKNNDVVDAEVIKNGTLTEEKPLDITMSEENKDSIESITTKSNEIKTTSSSEQSTYYSAGASSSDSIKSRNVFNLPEIDDMNFNPFATNTKIRQSPPRDVSMDNPFATKSKIINSPESSMVVQQSNDEEQINNATITEKHLEDKMETEPMEKDSSANISNITSSSKDTDKDATIKEVNTEDEDTIEGPFLEAEDVNEDKKSEFDAENIDMMQFNELPTQEHDENADGELFIDAEAFEFLLNQNKSNIVADSGKESLFLKFDPLFAKRMSSDSVVAAFNRAKKRQSTPTKAPKQQRNSPLSVAGPSTMNLNYETDFNVTETAEDLNTTVTKPMMVVTPAVNPTAALRKSVTPTRTNRRSITFTSPAMAVIDRLLSLSANSSLLEQETTIPQVSREQTEADLALTQLREVLAEKEIHVYNLRSESKELKDRLASLESQMKVLATEGQQRLKKINDLNDKLAEKTKMNKSMAAVVEEYERTIASLIAETEADKKRHAAERIALMNERDEQTAHLASMEVSFNDLHSKYEKSKQVILNYKANEETYKQSLREFEENVTKMQQNYELLKQHATSKLNHANDELQKINRAHEAEVLKLNAMIKRKDLHITSLEETLAQKTKANEELTAICDELINKVG